MKGSPRLVVWSDMVRSDPILKKKYVDPKIYPSTLFCPTVKNSIEMWWSLTVNKSLQTIEGWKTKIEKGLKEDNEDKKIPTKWDPWWSKS